MGMSRIAEACGWVTAGIDGRRTEAALHDCRMEGTLDWTWYTLRIDRVSDRHFSVVRITRTNMNALCSAVLNVGWLEPLDCLSYPPRTDRL